MAKADKTSADCSTQFRAFHTSGKRPIQDIRLIVLHSTEGGTAAGVAHYFTQANSGGSAHLVVDDFKCFRTLDNEDIPWAAPNANEDGFHIEQCGFAAWTNKEWTEHKATLLRAAYKTAFHCHKFGIPPKFILAADVKAGKKGITTHAEISKAFPNKLGNHHDPGEYWPRSYFMTAVRRYYKQLSES